MGDRWRGAGPPEEAYSRVSDPDRYLGLRPIGHLLLDDLERRYDVRREVTTDRDLRTNEPVAAIRLVPATPEAAPLGLAFGSFGLVLRTGRDDLLPLPQCGCDACDETVEDVADRLYEYVHAVVNGAFGERILRGYDGWWHERWYQHAGGSQSGRTLLDDAEYRALDAALPSGEQRWAPWPLREP
jgi:hypothetical protein